MSTIVHLETDEEKIQFIKSRVLTAVRYPLTESEMGIYLSDEQAITKIPYVSWVDVCQSKK